MVIYAFLWFFSLLRSLFWFYGVESSLTSCDSIEVDLFRFALKTNLFFFQCLMRILLQVLREKDTHEIFAEPVDVSQVLIHSLNKVLQSFYCSFLSADLQALFY